MIGRVAFVRQIIPDAVSVPLFAIVDKGGERVVFIEMDGIAESRTISIIVVPVLCSLVDNMKKGIDR